MLAVVAIAVLCVVGIGTLQIALKSGGRQEGGGSEDRPLRYFDPTYGFSLIVDPRFADDTAPGGIGPEVVYYTKVWLASGSPVEGEHPLDQFGVVVMDEERVATDRELHATVRTILSDPRMAATMMGDSARILKVRRSIVDGATAATIDAYTDDAVSGARVRSRLTAVLLPRYTLLLVGSSTPGTWRRNLPAFESMVASFRLPPDQR